jgi:hypothetical protein
MAAVALLALDILPVAHEAHIPYSVAGFGTSSARSAVVPAVGLPLRSHRVSVEGEEADPGGEGVDTTDAARLA